MFPTSHLLLAENSLLRYAVKYTDRKFPKHPAPHHANDKE
jgi:hypothetical protein